MKEKISSSEHRNIKILEKKEPTSDDTTGKYPNIFLQVLDYISTGESLRNHQYFLAGMYFQNFSMKRFKPLLPFTIIFTRKGNEKLK